MSISIVKFDALSDNVIYLFEEIKSANECNLISIEKMLPLLALKEGLIKPGKMVQVKIFGCIYSVIMSKNLRSECIKVGDGKNEVALPLEKLSLYYCFDANNLIDNKQELKQCREEFHQELRQKEALINKLEKELKEEKARADAAELKVETIFEKVEAIVEQKRKSAKRYIRKLDKKRSSNAYAGDSLFSSMTKILNGMDDLANDYIRLEYRIEYVVGSSDVVKKNQKIAVAKAYYNNTRFGEHDMIITAVEYGRIYLLMSSNSTVREGDAVALIGDLSDNKKDIMQWYEGNK